MLGIVMVVLDDSWVWSWVGNAFVLMAATTLALNFTLCRRSGIDMSPMLVFNGLIVGGGTALVLFLGEVEAAILPIDRWLLMALLCLCIVPAGVTLLQRGPLYLPAAEAGLLLLLEVVGGRHSLGMVAAERNPGIDRLGRWQSGTEGSSLRLGGVYETRGDSIPDMFSIHLRPPEVEKREIPGHWEGDLIEGKNNGSAVDTLVELNSGYLILAKMNDATATSAVEGFSAALNRMPRAARKDMNYDEGREMT